MVAVLSVQSVKLKQVEGVEFVEPGRVGKHSRSILRPSPCSSVIRCPATRILSAVTSASFSACFSSATLSASNSDSFAEQRLTSSLEPRSCSPTWTTKKRDEGAAGGKGSCFGVLRESSSHRQERNAEHDGGSSFVRRSESLLFPLQFLLLRTNSHLLVRAPFLQLSPLPLPSHGRKPSLTPPPLHHARPRVTGRAT